MHDEVPKDLAGLLGRLAAENPQVFAQYRGIEEDFTAQFRALLAIREVRIRGLLMANVTDPELLDLAAKGSLLAPKEDETDGREG